MKQIFIILLFISAQSFAQQPPPPISKAEYDSLVNNNIFSKVEIEARFNGSFKAFLEEHLRYPREAEKKKIQGVVIIEFIVDKEGNIFDVKLSEFSPQKNKWLAAEALRVIKLSGGKWLPGYQDGKPVKSYHQQSINFML